MKTPIQEVYAHLKASKEKDGFGEVYCVDWLLENESKILEKEKEVITEAYIEGCNDNILCESTDKQRAKEYYNETFNTKEK